MPPGRAEVRRRAGPALRGQPEVLAAPEPGGAACSCPGGDDHSGGRGSCQGEAAQHCIHCRPPAVQLPGRHRAVTDDCPLRWNDDAANSELKSTSLPRCQSASRPAQPAFTYVAVLACLEGRVPAQRRVPGPCAARGRNARRLCWPTAGGAGVPGAHRRVQRRRLRRRLLATVRLSPRTLRARANTPRVPALWCTRAQCLTLNLDLRVARLAPASPGRLV